MNDSFLNSANAPYVAELFFKYKDDPSTVDKSCPGPRGYRGQVRGCGFR